MSNVNKSEELASAALSDFEKFELFLSEKWRMLLGIAVSIVVVIMMVTVYSVIAKNFEAKAVNAISAAKSQAELRTVIGKYSSYPQVNSARIQLASILISEKKYEDAIKIYKDIVASNAPEILRWRAQADIGYLFEDLGKYDTAIETFETLAKNAFLPEIMKAEAGIAAGRLYLKMGNNGKARTQLEDVKKMRVPVWSAQADYLLDKVPAPAQQKPEPKKG